ncbi:hypothetical protein NDU88_002724 [Pleurodeles waltl]|uniref:Uncharacterized protein n=1 Tax=Pleurodeles waltl TaxID=8319 RepID=A0AAV7UXX5_PLEWA|nr:hypothetical protein NDU88_002724 [Pleurodeles waltl]
MNSSQGAHIGPAVLQSLVANEKSWILGSRAESRSVQRRGGSGSGVRANRLAHKQDLGQTASRSLTPQIVEFVMQLPRQAMSLSDECTLCPAWKRIGLRDLQST